MYYITKYADCWAIHNDDNGNYRRLTAREIEAVKGEYPQLDDPRVRTIFRDYVNSIKEKP